MPETNEHNTTQNPSIQAIDKKMAVMVALFAAFLAIAVMGVMAWSKPKPQPTPIVDNAGSASPSAKTPATITSETPDLVDSRVSELEDAIRTLQQTHEKEMADLQSKYASENAEAHKIANDAITAFSAFSQLKETIKTGAPYENELGKLRNIVGYRQQVGEVLSELAVHAKKGFSTPAALESQFHELVKLAIASDDNAIIPPVFSRFITIRRVGMRTGEDDESVIARAEILLKSGDIRKTIEELKNLSPQSEKVFVDWVTQAKLWLDSNEKLGLLQMLLTQPEASSRI